MSKSVLLVDTPEKCEDCKLLYHCHKYENVIIFNTKPDWCPLKELPEHELIWYEDADSDYERGFNACLDIILGE
jgi:hypothetical protein